MTSFLVVLLTHFGTMPAWLISGATLLCFYLSACSCQPDCTAVDCPPVENCIEEVLERGSCCAACLQKGCTCEGYQYYDCINAGFKNGKVQEGDSYYVDYGSTECSCPLGGGRISCSFISCPEMPPNCIEVSEPADGCMQCQRVGCVHNGQQYEAGHSFHINSCRVCHCPNEGGSLMCYPVPDCDPNKILKPILDPSAEADRKGQTSGGKFAQRGHVDHSTPLQNLSLFKVPLTKQEEAEDFIPPTTESPETYPHPTQLLAQIPPVWHGSERTSSVQSSDTLGKLEQREPYGVHDFPPDKEEDADSLLEVKLQYNTLVHSTPSWQSSQGAVSTPENVNQLNVLKTLDVIKFPESQGLQSEGPEHHQRISESRVHLQGGSESHHQNSSDATTPDTSFIEPGVSHSVRDGDTSADQQRPFDRFTLPMYIPQSTESAIHHQTSLHDDRIHGTALPEYDERMVEEVKADEDQATQTQRSVVRPEGEEVIHQSEQEQGEHQKSDGSFGETTPESSTSSPWVSRDLPTSMARLTTVPTTSQVPVTTVKDDQEPSIKPAPDLHQRHSEKPEGVPEDDQEGRNDRYVLLQKPEGGESTFLYVL